MLPKLLTVAISLVLALVVAEVGLRAFNYQPATMDPDMYVPNNAPLLPYKLKANYSGYCAGREVKTDAEGNRQISPSYSELRPGQQPERVILLVGDSGVFGFGLSDRDTIGSQLQRAALARNLNYEIRNLGVSGYTSWNEFEAINDYLTRNTVNDIVLLYMPNDLTFENDYFGVAAGKRVAFDRGEGRLPTYTRWLYSHVYVSYLLSDSAKRIAAALKAKPITASGRGHFDEQGKRAEIDYSMQALSRTREMCEARGINFQVGIYRDVAYFDDPEAWLSYEAAIGRHLEQRGIKWFITKEHTDRLPAGEIRVAWNDPHPSAPAAGLIAAEVSGVLSEK